MRPKIVGSIPREIVELLELNIKPGTPILCGQRNIAHMETAHPEDYLKYGNQLEDILAAPDYVSIHPTDGSVQFIKELAERVLVAVRLSNKGTLFARTLFVMSEEKWTNYTRKGYIKSISYPHNLPGCASEVRSI